MKQRRQFAPALVGAGLLAMGMTSQAQFFTGHYPVGVEGIKAGSLPPPGLYARDYNLFYSAHDFDGLPKGSDFEAMAYVNAPRLIYITDYKILGGYYGADVLVPFTYADVEFNRGGSRFSDSTFAMGDIFVEPVTLSWHGKQWDAAVGYGFWAPVGDFNEDGSRPARLTGMGFWSHMLSLGGTWYFCEDKCWAVSALNRYEIHMESDSARITPGDTYSLEFGVSRTLTKNIEAGLVGYYQQQVTKDRGDGVFYNNDVRDNVVGVGPEVSAFCEKLGLAASLRYVYEIEANDRPQGHRVTLTLTKPF